MRRLPALACLLLAAAPLLAAAQAAPAAPTAVAPIAADNTPPVAGEPAVRHRVSEDDSARIEELVVRGQLQRIEVKPKRSRLPAYQILPPDPARDPFGGPSGARSNGGERVWQFMAF